MMGSNATGTRELGSPRGRRSEVQKEGDVSEEEEVREVPSYS